MNNIQQIRFVNGMEVIGNILTWEEDTMIEANYLLEMQILPDFADDPDDDRSFYLLRPLVSYTDDLSKATSINPASIMAISDPAAVVIKQFKNSVKEITSQMGSKEEGETGSNVVAFAPKKAPEFLTED